MSIRDSASSSFALAGVALAGLSAYAWYAARRYEDLDIKSAGAPGVFLEADGVRIHYVEAGRGEPVLLIHGLNDSTFSFRYIIPELAQQYRVVALDLKGFGYSERPAGGDYSLTAQATLVGQVMRLLGMEQAAVVGHSMGGAVAMRLALREPQLVSQLVLVNSATDRQMRRGARLGPYLRPLLPLAALVYNRRRVRRFVRRSMLHDPAHLTPEMLEGYLRLSRMKGHLRASGALLAHRGRDEPLTLERIGQETLILWGEHDRLLPLSQGEELAGRIPNATLVLVPSSAHMPLEEQPEFCNRALLEFLRSPQPATVPVAAEPTSPLETPS